MYRCFHFKKGLALTFGCAVAGLGLAQLPILGHLGPLTLALLLGIIWKAFFEVPSNQYSGINFSAKSLLRIGIILLGVRLDFELIARAGVSIFFLSFGVIALGLFIFNWLGRLFKLPGNLPMLIAIDSSICGASAVAATAPVVDAKEEEMALVIPIGSLLGSLAVVGYTVLENMIHLPPKLYGMITGATLHEIAQVMAASHAIPDALEAGTITKLTRVLLLVPIIFAISFWRQFKTNRGTSLSRAKLFKSVPWFVFGFLIVGGACYAMNHFDPSSEKFMEPIKGYAIHISVFLMAMAMAGVGLQVDFKKLRESGIKTLAVAVIGWLFLVAFTIVSTMGM